MVLCSSFLKRNACELNNETEHVKIFLENKTNLSYCGPAVEVQFFLTYDHMAAKFNNGGRVSVKPGDYTSWGISVREGEPIFLLVRFSLSGELLAEAWINIPIEGRTGEFKDETRTIYFCGKDDIGLMYF